MLFPFEVLKFLNQFKTRTDKNKIKKLKRLNTIFIYSTNGFHTTLINFTLKPSFSSIQFDPEYNT